MLISVATLALCLLSLGVALWDWFSLRSVRRMLKEIKASQEE